MKGNNGEGKWMDGGIKIMGDVSKLKKSYEGG